MKVRNRAITDGEQAYTIAKTLEENNRARNDIAAKVQSKYNGSQPHNPADLRAVAEDWRNNFPTGFMSGIVDRVIPEFIQVIDSARYLTSAELSENNPEAQKKTEFFRAKVTKAIRSWDEWKTFNYALWSEDVLHGAAIVAALDPYTPWPKLYRLDQAFVPEGTGQHAKSIQVIAFKEDLMVHEFVDFIKDKDVAAEAGWNTEEAIEAVNDALPQSTLTEADGGTANSRKYEDSIRQGNSGAAHSGAKVIELYHVLAVEADTKNVTHYIINRRGNHEVLFQKDDRYDEMEDVVTPFTLQPGNGKFHDSKGLGRILLNSHIAIDRARNAMFDQLYISGLLILKTDATKTPQVQLKVRHPFILVTSDAEFAEKTIDSNVKAFIEADNQLSKWAEQTVGTYISGLTSENAPGQQRTATEASIEQNRDQKAKVASLARGWGQFSDLMGMVTRRLCDPETTDEIAKKLQKQLKEEGGLTRKEIDELAEAPAADVVQDITQVLNQQIIAAFTALRGDPAVNQHRLYDRFIAALVNPQFSADVLLDEMGLQANEAEGIRQQITESVDMQNGESVPVSPRDPHEIHLKTIFSQLKDAAQGLFQNPDPVLMDHANLALVHSKAHIDMWKQQGAKPAQTGPFEKTLKMFDDALQKLAEHVQQKQQQGQQQNGQQMGGMMPQGGPSQQGPPPNMEDHLLKITSSIAYKDAPDDIKRQIEAAAGFQPSRMGAEANSTLTAANLQHIQSVAQQAKVASAQPQQMAPPQVPQVASTPPPGPPPPPPPQVASSPPPEPVPGTPQPMPPKEFVSPPPQ